MRAAGSPSLKRMRVGMLITSNLRVMSRLSSMFSLAMFSLPACSVAISSSTGAIILHGPHHSAQKSTSTGTSEDLTCSSKLASLSVVIALLMAVHPPARLAGTVLCSVSVHAIPTTKGPASFPAVPQKRHSDVALVLEPVLDIDGCHA